MKLELLEIFELDNKEISACRSKPITSLPLANKAATK
jgi:hypothetical protein